MEASLRNSNLLWKTIFKNLKNVSVVQAPSPSFYRWETPWESNDMLRLTQQVTGKAKTCSTLFLEMCRAGQWNTLQVIKTHSFKQHLLCIFSFVLQIDQLLVLQNLKKCKPSNLPGCCWFLVRVVAVRDVGVRKQNCFHYHCHHLS